MPLLNPGDQFPDLTVTVAAGGTMELPGALAGSFGVVLFYRGSWSPYCNDHLRAVQRASEHLGQVGARVVALSVDDEATTKELIVKNKLTFAVGFGADALAVAELTGAFVNANPTCLQSPGFVLDPEGKVVISVYSSGAIGGLVAEDVIGLIRYFRQHAVSTSA